MSAKAPCQSAMWGGTVTSTGGSRSRPTRTSSSLSVGVLGECRRLVTRACFLAALSEWAPGRRSPMQVKISRSPSRTSLIASTRRPSGL